MNPLRFLLLLVIAIGYSSCSTSSTQTGVSISGKSYSYYTFKNGVKYPKSRWLDEKNLRYATEAFGDSAYARRALDCVMEKISKDYAFPDLDFVMGDESELSTDELLQIKEKLYEMDFHKYSRACRKELGTPQKFKRTENE